MTVISAAPARTCGLAEKQLATAAAANASSAGTASLFHRRAQITNTNVAAATAIAMKAGVAARKSPISMPAGCQWASRSTTVLVACRQNPAAVATTLAMSADK